jgi:hypothetical protein
MKEGRKEGRKEGSRRKKEKQKKGKKREDTHTLSVLWHVIPCATSGL